LLILLDEQLPRQLARHLVGHNVRTVQQQSWAGLKNGVLLGKAEAAGFSVLVTGDQSIEHQQLKHGSWESWSSAVRAMRLKTFCHWWQTLCSQSVEYTLSK
jgi:hypothetical protein